eukprot:1154196-Pelagomonas_calceolata.AAC.3
MSKLNRLKNYLPPLHQLEELSDSAICKQQQAMVYIDETQNRENSNMARKKLPELINSNPKRANRRFFKDKTHNHNYNHNHTTKSRVPSAAGPKDRNI